jgi:tripartite-type tricarboxylate transporter receptor subunit TctC
MRALIAVALLLAAPISTAAVLPAQAQPAQKPIQLIVPFAPGASADGTARLVGNDLAARLGRSVVIENKVGAGGSLGLTVLAKAPPDGDTLGIGATGALVVNPNLPGNGGFDPLRELVPIAKLVELPIVIVANPATGPKTIAELIARAKASPTGVSYGSTGVNTGQHFAMEFLKRATGAHLVHVPYRGSAPAVTDLLGGQLPVASVDLTSALPYIQSGRLVALGIPHGKRSALAPDIPTVAEAGVPGFAQPPGFLGLFAPAGTPDAVIKPLSREVGAILASADIQAKIRLLAAEAAYEDDVAFGKFLIAEAARWKEALASMPASN